MNVQTVEKMLTGKRGFFLRILATVVLIAFAWAIALLVHSRMLPDKNLKERGMESLSVEEKTQFLEKLATEKNDTPMMTTQEKLDLLKELDAANKSSAQKKPDAANTPPPMTSEEKLRFLDALNN